MEDEMSTQFTERPDHGPDTARVEVAAYPTYWEAERAVDWLSDNKFPVEHAAIVGRGLHTVEQVTGRLTYGGAALRGALTGALVGLLIGWLFAVFAWFDPDIAWGWLIVDGLWFGALVGATFGLVQHAVLGGRRDFASVGMMRADSYAVMVDTEVADEAKKLLRELSERPPAAERRPERGSGPISRSRHRDSGQPAT
jgi:hypothetical protein